MCVFTHHCSDTTAATFLFFCLPSISPPLCFIIFLFPSFPHLFHETFPCTLCILLFVPILAPFRRSIPAVLNGLAVLPLHGVTPLNSSFSPLVFYCRKLWVVPGSCLRRYYLQWKVKFNKSTCYQHSVQSGGAETRHTSQWKC